MKPGGSGSVGFDVKRSRMARLKRVGPADRGEPSMYES